MSITDQVCEHNEKERMCFYCHTKQRDRIIALLRAEVKAWRSGWYDDDASEGELARARAATDAANALEDK